MTPYETTIIFDPQLQEEGWEKAVEKYAAIITRKGIIKRTDRWGLRRLAYEIKKRAQGYYVHFVHESPPEIPREIERQCLLDETCLRYLTVVAGNPKYQEEMDKRQAARESAAVVVPPVHPAESRTAVDTTDDKTTPAPAEVKAEVKAEAKAEEKPETPVEKTAPEVEKTAPEKESESSA